MFHERPHLAVRYMVNGHLALLCSRIVASPVPSQPQISKEVRERGGKILFRRPSTPVGLRPPYVDGRRSRLPGRKDSPGKRKAGRWFIFEREFWVRFELDLIVVPSVCMRSALSQSQMYFNNDALHPVIRGSVARNRPLGLTLESLARHRRAAMIAEKVGAPAGWPP